MVTLLALIWPQILPVFEDNLKDLSPLACCRILFTGGPDVLRKEAWSFYRTSSGVCLYWEVEVPKGPKGPKDLNDLTGRFTARRKVSGGPT